MMQGRLGHTQSGSCINRSNFKQSNDQTAGSKIAYGLDLQAYNGVQSGKNLSGAGVPIVLNATLGASTANAAADAAILVDLYLQYDCIFTLDGVSGVIAKSD